MNPEFSHNFPSGLQPKVYTSKNVIFFNETAMSLQCNVLGQPMTTIQWQVDGEIITNDEYYNASLSVDGKSSDLNVSYISHLRISHKILDYFGDRTDSHCEIVDTNNTVDCSLSYICKAFYVESEAVQENANAIFKYNGKQYFFYIGLLE